MAPVTTRNRLEGVTATADLWSLYGDCLALSQNGETKPLLTSVSTDDSEVANTTSTSNNPPSSSTTLLNPLSLEEARTTLAEFQQKSKNKKKRPNVLPIALIRAMKVILTPTTKDKLLEDALHQTQLISL